MPTKTENEEIIRRFLLGEMSESERTEFEERFIEKAELFEEIKAFEDDLIERYVRGWLNTAERSEFERAFLTTETRRERVEFARQFINKIRSEAAAAVQNKSESKSVWQNLTDIFLTPKIAVATAFSLLLVAFGSWFMYQNLFTQDVEIVKDDNSNIPETPAPIIELPPQNLNQNTDENVSESLNLNKDEANSQKTETPTPTPIKTPEIEKTPSPKKTPQRRKVPNPVLALFSGTLRSGGKTGVLNLPKEAEGGTLQLNLENVDYQIFKAELNDADANVIFQKGNLRSGNSKINVFIPARNLKKGDYILKLYGRNASGEFESVADFQFRVNK